MTLSNIKDNTPSKDKPFYVVVTEENKEVLSKWGNFDFKYKINFLYAGNRQKISIEICYSKSGDTRFTQAEQNSAELVASICKRYGWGIDKVTKHQDYSGKYCPHRTLDKGWQRFINLVNNYLNPVTITLYTVTSKNGLKCRTGAGLLYPQVASLRYNQKVQVFETKNGWAKTNLGWSSLLYLKKT
jgi:N-acetylmuramoyl-L-alanine amidase CwlA